MVIILYLAISTITVQFNDVPNVLILKRSFSPLPKTPKEPTLAVSYKFADSVTVPTNVGLKYPEPVDRSIAIEEDILPVDSTLKFNRFTDQVTGVNPSISNGANN